jgi:hypothetical protein
VSGGAERRRRTTRRCFRKIFEDIVVRRISGNVGCTSVENVVNIPSIKNRAQRQFLTPILNCKLLCILHFNIRTLQMICLEQEYCKSVIFFGKLNMNIITDK